MKFFHVSLFMLISTLIFSCKNKDVTQDVERYCACLEEFQHDAVGRETCIEMMFEIKEKYAHDGRALMQILEETDKCL